MLREDVGNKQATINTFLLKLLPEEHPASSTLTCQKQNSFLAPWNQEVKSMQNKKLSTQEGRMLYLFSVRQAKGDSQTRIHPQESSSLAAAALMQHIASHQHHTQCHLLGPVGLFVFQRKQQISPFLFSAFYHMPLPCVSEQGMYINEANQRHTHSHICLGNLHRRQPQVDSYSWLDVSSGRRGLVPSSEGSWFRPHLPFFKVLVSILHRLITVSIGRISGDISATITCDHERECLDADFEWKKL